MLDVERWAELRLTDPFPWTEDELGRELSPDSGRDDATDAVASLNSAGLVHRFEVKTARGPIVRIVIPTRAARQGDELYEGAM